MIVATAAEDRDVDDDCEAYSFSDEYALYRLRYICGDGANFHTVIKERVQSTGCVRAI